MYSFTANKTVGAEFIISADLSCEIVFRISNVEPQNYEVVTSTFDISCSIFCGLKKVLTKSIVTMATVSSVCNDQRQAAGIK